MMMLRLLVIISVATVCLWSVSAQADELIPSLLLESVVNGDVDGIDRAIEAGENIDLVNDKGWSAAMFAVNLGDMDVLDRLISHQIDLNNADNEGVSPLIAAAALADKEMVQMLLAANANPLQKTGDGADAYDKAIEAGRKLVALMIAEAAATYAIETDNLSELMKAIQRGAYINIRNNAGWTPLMFAVAEAEPNIVKVVLEHGPDLNRTENDGWNALHFAAARGNADIVNILLKAGMDPQVATAAGQTPREIALTENHQEVADLLK
jgi:ankyrin repeat protein